MKKAPCIILSLLVSVSALGTALGISSAAADEQAAAKGDAADALKGKWKHPEEDIVIEIVRSGANFEGKVVQSTVAAAPVGKQLIRGVTYDAAKGEWHGEVLAVKRGEFVPMTAKVSGGSMAMTAGKGMMSKKLTWARK